MRTRLAQFSQGILPGCGNSILASMMNGAKYVHLLLAAVVLSALCDTSCEEAVDTTWLQLHVANDSQPKLLKEQQTDCLTDDMACVARKTACNLAKTMKEEWPLEYSNISRIVDQLNNVCLERPLSLEEPKATSLATSVAETNASLDCEEDPASCILNVVEYESKNAGAKYGMQTGKFAAKAASDTLKEVLKSAKDIALRGTIAFAWVGAAISAFFPRAGGLPVNPCTYAANDWGRCVWEQIKPFVQEFVSQQLDEAFSDLWEATIKGYQTRLWALNFVAYKNSELYPNGTIKYMADSTRDRMYDELRGVHNAMLGSVNLFVVDRAIDTTAGAYLAQFASLHSSVMTNLMGSTVYRTKGDRLLYQQLLGCYAVRIYQRATQAFQARMSALSEYGGQDGILNCCPGGGCTACLKSFHDYKDTWRDCEWTDGYGTTCRGFKCAYIPRDPYTAKACYKRHSREVEKQLVNFWADWLAPVPIWLNNVVLMQDIPVNKTVTGTATSAKFTCPF